MGVLAIASFGRDTGLPRSNDNDQIENVMGLFGMLTVIYAWVSE
jgi:hypothetical protein